MPSVLGSSHDSIPVKCEKQKHRFKVGLCDRGGSSLIGTVEGVETMTSILTSGLVLIGAGMLFLGVVAPVVILMCLAGKCCARFMGDGDLLPKHH